MHTQPVNDITGIKKSYGNFTSSILLRHGRDAEMCAKSQKASPFKVNAFTTSQNQFGNLSSHPSVLNVVFEAH